MRRVLPWLMLILGLALFGGYFGWAFLASGGFGEAGSQGMAFAWAILGGGVLLTGALTGFFMWLAFHSSRRGYDASADPWRRR
jgi:hypothetical protein